MRSAQGMMRAARSGMSSEGGGQQSAITTIKNAIHTFKAGDVG